MKGFLRDFGDRQPDGTYTLRSSYTSLFASIVQAGEFFGALAAGKSPALAARRSNTECCDPRRLRGRLRRPKGCYPSCYNRSSRGCGSPANCHWKHPSFGRWTIYLGDGRWRNLELRTPLPKRDTSRSHPRISRLYLAAFAGCRTSNR